MLFQTWEYLLLLTAAVAIISFMDNATAKKLIVLSMSFFFYAYGSGWQVLLFAAIILLAYMQGRLFAKKRSKLLLYISIIALFLPLFLYKYVPFILSDIMGIAAARYQNTFVLPIGISFYTFQAASYVIDVYRNKSCAERNLITFACFLSFFPQLVAGPIERNENLMHQIRSFKKPSVSDLSVGFRHILLGLSLKLLVAETMASFVNPVYNDLSGKGGLSVLIATFCFGIQIYCDFNGYSQIALGSARLMGVRLMQNFDHPYCAPSPADFWRRWHISLTSWFTDYVYIPLGGNRKGKVRTALNKLITFSVSGIWHGANWTFLCWGLLNGLGVVSYRRKTTKAGKWRKICGVILTGILINLFWVMFRANSIGDAISAYKLIFTDTAAQLFSLRSFSQLKTFFLYENGWSNAMFLPAAVSLLIYIWYEYGHIFGKGLTAMLYSEKRRVRWMIYILLIVLTLYFGQTLQQSSFVYFRF